MRWLKMLMVPFVLLGTGVVAMMTAYPEGKWHPDMHWGAAVFVVLAGLFVAMSLLLAKPAPSEWTPERQIEHLRTVVSTDWRWLSSSPIADALTTRYGALLASNWQTKTVEPVEALRTRLGLDPFAPATTVKLAPALIVEKMNENDRRDEAAHNAALSMVIEAIRETENRDVAIERIEGLRK